MQWETGARFSAESLKAHLFSKQDGSANNDTRTLNQDKNGEPGKYE